MLRPRWTCGTRRKLPSSFEHASELKVKGRWPEAVRRLRIASVQQCLDDPSPNVCWYRFRLFVRCFPLISTVMLSESSVGKRDSRAQPPKLISMSLCCFENRPANVWKMCLAHGHQSGCVCLSVNTLLSLKWLWYFQSNMFDGITYPKLSLIV